MKRLSRRSGESLLVFLVLVLGGAVFWPVSPSPARFGCKAVGIAVARADQDERTRALRKLQKRIEREQRALLEVNRKSDSAVELLRTMEQVLSEDELEMQRAEQGVREARRRLAKLEAQRGQIGSDLANLETRLAKRLSALYKLGDVGYFRILFSSKDYQDLARRTRFLKRIIASDAALIKDYQEKLTALRRQAREVEGTRKELSDLKTAAESRREAVESRRREKVALLERLRSEKEARLEAIRDLQRAAEELQGTFEELREVNSRPGGDRPERLVGAEPFPLEDFSRRRGQLPMPVKGSIIRGFGLQTDPELGTQIRSNGITVRAPYGEAIHAVHDGRVLYAGWFRGYGRILIMDHGEGYYTLVGHASELLKRVGDPVRQGETIARVGESGSLQGPVLYFEIRNKGKPVDPLEWIKH
jgi:septal ring factor EnvC (AmiA/AmiB activator)